MTGAGGCEGISFRTDLYEGTAEYYDRFRRPYPADLINDLVIRTGADGTGTLLDLACGTGQVAVALHEQFASICAVDQEPGMIGVLRRKAAALPDAAAWQFVVAAAEEVSVPESSVDLATIGSAFHRLRRDAVAARVLRWLKPGGHLALLWPGSPNIGDAPWQAALQATMQRWQDRPGADERIPAGYEADRSARPDLEILRAAGFDVVSRQEFPVTQVWTVAEIAGFVASTSVLSPAALGADAAEFDADLRRALLSCETDGRFRQDTTFACELARRPC
ncbi:MAG TPA: class I SAM-dependent methyltransferase [Streptosporangiaceae bacterium]|nr:class I SAM-dependent methyltransferase [Streptosporangiaceae bacterium]